MERLESVSSVVPILRESRAGVIDEISLDSSNRAASNGFYAAIPSWTQTGFEALGNARSMQLNTSYISYRYSAPAPPAAQDLESANTDPATVQNLPNTSSSPLKPRRDGNEKVELKLLQSTPAAVTCHVCHRVLSKKSALNRHMITTHNDLTTRTFKCGICDRSFARRDTMQRHMLTHDKLHYPECKGCGKKFRPDFLQSHLRATANGGCREAHERSIANSVTGSRDQPAALKRLGTDLNDSASAIIELGLPLEDHRFTMNTKLAEAAPLPTHDQTYNTLAQIPTLGSTFQNCSVPFGSRDGGFEGNNGTSNHQRGSTCTMSSHRNLAPSSKEPITLDMATTNFCPWDECREFDWADRFWVESDLDDHDAGFDGWVWSVEEYM